jgi:hypothetical protein
MLAERARTGTLLRRFPTLAAVADYAAFRRVRSRGRDDQRDREPDLQLARRPAAGQLQRESAASSAERMPKAPLRSAAAAEGPG